MSLNIISLWKLQLAAGEASVAGGGGMEAASLAALYQHLSASAANLCGGVCNGGGGGTALSLKRRRSISINLCI